MFDEDINSNCDSENKTYEDFKFRQMCKELWLDITKVIIDFLFGDDEGQWVEKK